MLCLYQRKKDRIVAILHLLYIYVHVHLRYKYFTTTNKIITAFVIIAEKLNLPKRYFVQKDSVTASILRDFQLQCFIWFCCSYFTLWYLDIYISLYPHTHFIYGSCIGKMGYFGILRYINKLRKIMLTIHHIDRKSLQ